MMNKKLVLLAVLVLFLAAVACNWGINPESVTLKHNLRYYCDTNGWVNYQFDYGNNHYACQDETREHGVILTKEFLLSLGGNNPLPTPTPYASPTP